MVKFITMSGSEYLFDNESRRFEDVTNGTVNIVHTLYTPPTLGRSFTASFVTGRIFQTSPICKIEEIPVRKRISLVKKTVARPLMYFINTDKNAIMQDFSKELNGAENIRFHPVGVLEESILVEVSGIVEYHY